MVSAHWEERPDDAGATRTVPLVYDFYGFPERYYETRYPAPGAPELAARVRELLRAARARVRRRSGPRARPRRLRAARRDVSATPTCRCSSSRCPASIPRRSSRSGRALAPLPRRRRARLRKRLPHPQHALRVPPRHPRLGAGVRRLGRRRALPLRHRRADRLPRARPGRADGSPHLGALRSAAGGRRCGERQRHRRFASRSPASGWKAPSPGARSSLADGDPSLALAP